MAKQEVSEILTFLFCFSLLHKHILAHVLEPGRNPTRYFGVLVFMFHRLRITKASQQGSALEQKNKPVFTILLLSV